MDSHPCGVLRPRVFGLVCSLLVLESTRFDLWQVQRSRLSQFQWAFPDLSRMTELDEEAPVDIFLRWWEWGEGR